MFNQRELMYITIGISHSIEKTKNKLNDAQKTLFYDMQALQPEEFIAKGRCIVEETQNELNKLVALYEKLKKVGEIKSEYIQLPIIPNRL